MAIRFSTSVIHTTLLALTYLHLCDSSSNILFVSLYGSKDHIVTFLPAIEALNRRGHNVTYLTFTMPENYHLNASIHLLKLEGIEGANQINRLNYMMPTSVANFILTTMINVCSAVIEDTNFKRLLEDNVTKFDVIIMDPSYSECGLPLVWLLGNPPFIYYSTTTLYSWTALQLDIPTPFAYVPLHLTQFTDEMTFSERYSNTLATVAITVFRNYVLIPKAEKLFRKRFPSVPSLLDLERNVSFVFSNTHSASLDFSRPLSPFFAEVGGTHCRSAKQLPQDLEDFIKESGNDGFIYISVGSDFSEAFLGAFKRIKQRVVWKFEDDLPNLPSNVRTFKWVPQQDVLGHSKIKLFITQGGQQNVQEAVYHNVSVLGLPILDEQVSIIKNLKHKGIAEILDHNGLTEEVVYEAIRKMLHNLTKYKENCRFYSVLFRDRPMEAIDTVVYWVEYIIRNKGGQHLRFNIKHLNFFQYFLLDIIGLTLLVTTVMLYVLIKTCKFFCNKQRPTAGSILRTSYNKKSK